MKVAIASGKGGTGKTTIATNLAALIAEKEGIVLCDLDVEEPNSSLFFEKRSGKSEVKYKMIPEWNQASCNLCGNCSDICNFNAIIHLGTQILVFPELCHSCFACSEMCPTSSLPMKPRRMGILSQFSLNRLLLVESRLDVGQEQAVPLISQTKDQVESGNSSGKIIIYDSPPGTSCPVIEATKDADLVLLVTEPTPFGLHDLKLAVDTMKDLGRDMAVIINRYDGTRGIIDEYCETEGLNIIARVPDNRKSAELYSAGKLIYLHNEEFRDEIKTIRDYIKSRDLRRSE